MADPTPDDVLATPMPPGNMAGVDSVGQLLVALSRQVWVEGECFSGGMPFGEGTWGWEWELAAALGDAGYVRVTPNPERALPDVDFVAVKRLIAAAYARLFELVPPSRCP